MIRNYFKIAWRNLSSNKSFAVTNIVGLSLGIACAILIFTVVTYHLSFDNFHYHNERIYRVVTEFHNESIEYQPGTPQPLGKAFRNDFSFAEKTARVRTYHDATISIEEEHAIKKFQEQDLVAFAEPEFFDIFNFPLEEGSGKIRLEEPNSALITQKLAKKYFGNGIAMGKIIRVTSGSHHVDFKITGILKNIPANTDRKQEIYLSYPNLKNYNSYFASDSSWGGVSSNMHFFVLLKPGVTKTMVERSFGSFEKKYLDAEDAKVTQFKLQPISDIHFNTDFDGNTNKKYLWVLALIGFFLILTAAVNFVNLATAQAFNRSKEVGVRKVLGSRRHHLFLQFITETGLIALSAVFLAYFSAKLALPYLNELFKENMTIDVLQHWQLPVFIVFLMILVIFISGSYPGLVLAGIHPVEALKGRLSQKNMGGFSLRKALVIVQFAISQILIIGIIIIAGQMHYSKTSDLGFSREAILMLPVPNNDKTKMNELRTGLSGVAGVKNISLCFNAPASSGNSLTSIRFANHVKDEPWEINLKDADDQYVPTFNLKLIAGRNFFPSDTIQEMLVNETVVKKLGLSPQEIIGKKLSVNGGTINAPVAGVVKDFYNNSFHASISPIVIMSNYNRYQRCAVKMNVAYAKPTREAFKKIWENIYPEYVYASYFLDERIAEFYRQDDVMFKLIEIFAGIAILIACLGLYGLVSFMAVQKTKEIGVRKVLGAGVQSILWLFGKEFTQLLLIAFVIAAPVAFLAMNKWLQDFAYRIKIGPGIFLMAIGLTFIIAALTVGTISIKAAFANPVKSLRSE